MFPPMDPMLIFCGPITVRVLELLDLGFMWQFNYSYHGHTAKLLRASVSFFFFLYVWFYSFHLPVRKTDKEECMKILCVLESKCNGDICKADFCVTLKPAASALGCCQDSNIRNGAVRRASLTATDRLQLVQQMLIPNSIPLLTQHPSWPLLCSISWYILRHANSF